MTQKSSEGVQLSLEISEGAPQPALVSSPFKKRNGWLTEWYVKTVRLVMIHRHPELSWGCPPPALVLHLMPSSGFFLMLSQLLLVMRLRILAPGQSLGQDRLWSNPFSNLAYQPNPNYPYSDVAGPTGHALYLMASRVFTCRSLLGVRKYVGWNKTWEICRPEWVRPSPEGEMLSHGRKLTQ